MARSWASSAATRKSMQSNRSRDTKPELALRKQLHALGLRYRVCARPIPDVRRTADVVFPSARVAVEVRGCFWHGCPEHYRAPAANATYWSEKVSRNQQRDDENALRLQDAGWLLEVVWEHEDSVEASQRIAAIVLQRRQAAVEHPGPTTGN
jgi:DNA mismatch endonuclease (patch repair protein)